MKERIAIFIDTKENSGGAYEESLYLIENIKKYNNNELDIVAVSTSQNLSKALKKNNFETYYFSMNAFERYVGFIRNYGNFARRFKKYFFFSNKLEKFLTKKNIDLVYFTNPSPYSLYLEDIDLTFRIYKKGYKLEDAIKEVEKLEDPVSSELQIFIDSIKSSERGLLR